MSDQAIGKKLEMYARKNIPEREKAFGEFMYHAELIKKGHWDIHYQDLESVSAKYRTIMEDICDQTNEPDMYDIAYEVTK
jgi:hypothetical protein